MHNIMNALKDLADFEKLDIAEVISESAADMTPVLGSFLTNLKIRRLAKRLTSVEAEINQIRDLISATPNQEKVEQMKDFVLPIFLQKLLEEDEEQKLKFVVNSIKRFIEVDTLDESQLILIFDILDKLRFIEIDYLKSLRDGIEFLPGVNASANIITFIEDKLEGIGLIHIAYRGKLVGDTKGAAISYSDKTEISPLGIELLNFINE
ncbi:hypothetical protein [Lysinibacillus sp. JNUCC-52]|uniref:hypothetical protein n=1 Tax=Lysinibacillus sp. JNUCC-52 TaxID=2792480 RepID=UPI001934F4AF|nr:hypothetical protein JNUCC52_02830 [Lysinibacillus sp. JNUCC-52]